MPKEIYPSSYLCDCGHQSDFFENTIREVKRMSQKKKVRLADSMPNEHTIIFYRGQMVDIVCPNNNRPAKHPEKPTKSEVDQIVISQADDDTAWEQPIYVERSTRASLTLPGDLAARATFLAQLHRAKSVEQWLARVIQERVELEEAVFAGLKQDLVAVGSIR